MCVCVVLIVVLNERYLEHCAVWLFYSVGHGMLPIVGSTSVDSCYEVNNLHVIGTARPRVLNMYVSVAWCLQFGWISMLHFWWSKTQKHILKHGTTKKEPPHHIT